MSSTEEQCTLVVQTGKTNGCLSASMSRPSGHTVPQCSIATAHRRNDRESMAGYKDKLHENTAS